MATQQLNPEASSKVLERLRGKHVLITGTTGFLGKVVLEKLIRAVPDIGGIHLLIRGNKRHPNARERFYEEIATSSVFDRLRQDDNDAFETFIEERVHCVTGEVTEPLFGLSGDRFRKLAGGIDVVINSAASVNFREELDKALAINTRCLENVNGMNSGQITETVIKPAGESIPRSTEGYYEIEELVRLLEDKISDVRSRYSGKMLEKKLVDLGIREANHYGWSDTYTFTKWLGEQLLLKALSGRALTIVRPFIDHLMAESRANFAEYDQLFYRQPTKPFIAVNRRLFDAVVGGVRIPLSITGKVLRMLGQNRELKVLRNLDTTRSLATIFGFYTAPDYIFRNDDLLALASRMGELDKVLFPVDARQIDWSVYLRKIHLAGLNRYALKERKVYSLRSAKARKKAA